MSAPQYTLRSEFFPAHHPLFWQARERAFGEIAWFEAALGDAVDTVDCFVCEASEHDLEAWHGAAEAAEWLLENPNAASILKAQGRLGVAERWAAWRPIIERRAIDLHRSCGAGEGA